MNPVTHGLLSWLVANGAGLERRERLAVTLAGLAPDLDGLGMIAELATRDSAQPLLWWSDYHHVLGHNLAFAIVCAAVAWAASGRRWRTAALAVATFHLHLLCDLVGGRGPDGHQWPIHYLYPFSDAGAWRWSGQWALNAWPNVAITVAALLITFVLAWRRGFSPLEMVSLRADQALVAALRRRFGAGGRTQP